MGRRSFLAAGCPNRRLLSSCRPSARRTLSSEDTVTLSSFSQGTNHDFFLENEQDPIAEALRDAASWDKQVWDNYESRRLSLRDHGKVMGESVWKKGMARLWNQQKLERKAESRRSTVKSKMKVLNKSSAKHPKSLAPTNRESPRKLSLGPSSHIQVPTVASSQSCVANKDVLLQEWPTYTPADTVTQAQTREAFGIPTQEADTHPSEEPDIDDSAASAHKQLELFDLEEKPESLLDESEGRIVGEKLSQEVLVSKQIDSESCRTFGDSVSALSESEKSHASFSTVTPCASPQNRSTNISLSYDEPESPLGTRFLLEPPQLNPPETIAANYFEGTKWMAVGNTDDSDTVNERYEWFPPLHDGSSASETTHAMTNDSASTDSTSDPAILLLQESFTGNTREVVGNAMNDGSVNITKQTLDYLRNRRSLLGGIRKCANIPKAIFVTPSRKKAGKEERSSSHEGNDKSANETCSGVGHNGTGGGVRSSSDTVNDASLNGTCNGIGQNDLLVREVELLSQFVSRRSCRL